MYIDRSSGDNSTHYCELRIGYFVAKRINNQVCSVPGHLKLPNLSGRDRTDLQVTICLDGMHALVNCPQNVDMKNYFIYFAYQFVIRLKCYKVTLVIKNMT